MERRTFLAGLAASGVLLTPFSGWTKEQDATPAYVAAFKNTEGNFGVGVLDDAGRLLFQEMLDGRGHDIAISPDHKQAVAFARRPGRFALVIDLKKQKRKFAFAPPADRHFYGHGVFSHDGRLLYATENDYASGRGMLGIYDVTADFQRIGELDTFGIGPHEVLILSDNRTLAIANGGILTHPDYPRRKLNISDMQPSLVYIDATTGDLLEQVFLPPHIHQLSIRHMAQTSNNAIWFGGQYEGLATDEVSLVGLHQRGKEIELLSGDYGAMDQYIGSVASSTDGQFVATTAPRGEGTVLIWNTASKTVVETIKMPDVAGAAPTQGAFLLSNGEGKIARSTTILSTTEGVFWDNHLRKI